MFNSIKVIALNTVRQTVRERLFYNIIVFGIGLLLLSAIVGNLTFGHSDRVIRSIGLSGVSIALDLMGLLLGVNLIHQEIDRKTLFVVLTRPIRRWEYVIGRFGGLCCALAMAGAGLSLVLVVALILAHGTPEVADLYALSATLIEAWLIGGVGAVLSSFSTPTLSAGIGLGVWIVSATSDDLLHLAERSDDFTKTIVRAVYYLFPSLARFNFREAAVYQVPIAAADFFGAMAYGLIYAAALVALSSAILSRREMV